MNKVYQRTYWENKPSEKTPINEASLNKMDYALNEIDNRVVKFARQKDAMEVATQNASTAAANANTATANATKATESANKAAQSATTAANNANEAAQAIFDENYILTARTEFAKSARVSPTAKGNAILEKLRGDSWQKQLIGKNKFDITTMLSSLAKRNDGCFKNANGDTGSICNIPVVAGQTYTVTAYILGATTQSAWLRLSVQDGKDVKYTSFDDSIVTVVGLTTEYVKTVVTFTALSDWISISSLGSIRDDMQVELGETSTDSEEFCGNTTSPNPSYEQKVRSVGDMGWFDGELLNGYYDTSGKFVSESYSVCSANRIPCKNGDVVTINSNRDGNYRLVLYNNGAFITRYAISAMKKTHTFTIVDDCDSFYFGQSNVGDNVTPAFTVTINDKYALIADECNKNLFGGDTLADAIVGLGGTKNEDNKTVTWLCNTIENKPITNVGLKFKANTVYTIILYGKCGNDSEIFSNLSVRYTDGSTQEITSFATKGKHSYSRFITQSGKTIESIRPHWGSWGTTLYYEKCGVFEGVVSLEEFSEHQSSRHYIPLDEPLRGIGDVKDGVLPQDGLYGDYREYACVDLGSLNWTYVNGFFRTTDLKDIMPSGANSNLNEQLMLCEMFIIDTYSNVTALKNDNRISVCGSDYEVRIRCSKYTDASEFKSAMNGVMLQYRLATPTFTPFEDQTPFYNFESYDEVTYVSIVGHEELEPMATIRFPRNEDGALETTNHCEKQLLKIENKAIRAEIEELTAALLALGRE